MRSIHTEIEEYLFDQHRISIHDRRFRQQTAVDNNRLGETAAADIDHMAQ
jgi:hypothetical protein